MDLALVKGREDEQEQFIERAREMLAAYIRDTGRSQGSLARALDVSAGTVSQFLKGQYAGDLLAVAKKVMNFLELEAQRARAPKPIEFVETSIAREIFFVLNYAHTNRDVGEIHGEAGVGKTEAVKAYVRQHPDVIYVCANPCVTSPKAILEEILLAMRRPAQGSLRQLRREIVAILKGSGRMIVVDEDQYLTDEALNTLRSLHDEAEIGLVLVGNGDLVRRMHGKEKDKYAHLTTRVGVRRYFRRDIKEEDVNLIFDDTPLGVEGKKYLARLASAEGLRFVVKLYHMAASISSGPVIGLDVLEWAYNSLKPREVLA